MPSEQPLPYGTPDLDPEVRVDPGPPWRVCCYVRGCGQLLMPAKDFCPVHGIRCHHSRSVTYSYRDVRRNIIVAPDLLATRGVGHPFKYDSNRLGLENSEDALAWNVFRSLQEAGCLREVARLVTGQDGGEEPLLFLWGLCLTGDTLEPWDLLIAARARFESALPVKRPLTEPDIGLYLPGRYLILIEAKFTSANPCYKEGSRKDATSLTKAELLSIYHDPALLFLDAERARRGDKVYYQLWRNMFFAEWMARADGRGTQAYHANLTRASYEADSCEHFRQMLRPGFTNRFAHLAWEGFYSLCEEGNLGLLRLRSYLATKTACLRQAFQVCRRR